MCKEKNLNFLETVDRDLSLFSLTSPKDGPIKIRVKIDGKPFDMELDTGSENTVISENTYKSVFSNYSLRKIDMLLKAYNGTNIIPIGACDVFIQYGNIKKLIPIIVIKHGGPPLLGRNFLKAFKIEICNINYASELQMMKSNPLVKKFNKFFDGGLGLFRMSKAVLRVREDAVPKFFRPRPLPLAIKNKVESGVDDLVKMGILKPVEYSEWGTPIVPILKKDGSVSICGDFKVTLNPFLMVEKYPLPRIEEIFAKLHGGVEFTKLDLSMAYQQIELDEGSREYTTISTSKGLF